MATTALAAAVALMAKHVTATSIFQTSTSLTTPSASLPSLTPATLTLTPPRPMTMTCPPRHLPIPIPLPPLALALLLPLQRLRLRPILVPETPSFRLRLLHPMAMTALMTVPLLLGRRRLVQLSSFRVGTLLGPLVDWAWVLCSCCDLE